MQQLDLTRLDPWFIEVCRRVRLDPSSDGFSAKRSTSKAARIDAKAFKGVTGDPWASIHVGENKGLTLGERDFTYGLLVELLFSNTWRVPPLAEPGPEHGDCLLVAEALSRGNSKTDGWKSRIVPMPGAVRGLFRTETAGTFTKAQIEEIKEFDEALRDALALMAARGDYETRDKKHYEHTRGARTRFDRAADVLFFLCALHSAARQELEAALPAIPCAAIHRPRAETRARRAFRRRLWKADFHALFEKEPADA